MTNDADISTHPCSAHECGAPASSSWTSSRGTTYFECAEHDTTEFKHPAQKRVGDSISVDVYGTTKSAVITKITGTFIWAEVAVYENTTRATTRIVKIRR